MRTQPSKIAALGIAVLLMTSSVSFAETVTKRTLVTPNAPLNGEKINLQSFDMNNNGILSRKEIGTRLFYLFDTDGNEVIDNIEYDQPRLITVTPMLKEEFMSIDFDDDGVADVTDYTQEDFLKKSMLYDLDQNKDGLSAHEFLKVYLTKADTDKSKMLELDEWRTVYTENVSGPREDPDSYNR